MTYIIMKEDMLQTMLKMQLNEVNHCGLKHIAQYSPEYVFKMISMGHRSMPIRGYTVHTGSQRYRVFKESCTCVECGVVGTVMCLDEPRGSRRRRNRKQKGAAHFNLYGITPSGRVVMLTKDHILPKSKGGSNRLDNYQTMCETCNQRKGDK